jgi:hypothetical protein
MREIIISGVMRVAFITWCYCISGRIVDPRGRLNAEEEKEEEKEVEEEDKEDMMSQVQTLMLAGLELFDRLLGSCVLLSSSPSILSLSLSLSQSLSLSLSLSLSRCLSLSPSLPLSLCPSRMTPLLVEKTLDQMLQRFVYVTFSFNL